ncbi:MAG: thermonuclease family protein [Ilumatobacteraceae bacterium]
MMPNFRAPRITRSLAALLVVASCGQSRNSAVNFATVIEVIDGDTVDLSIDGHRQRVRLIGVDTPETKHPRKPVECYGHEATVFAESLLPQGTNGRLERDAEARDTYDRLLVYLYRNVDNMFINLELVRQGFAHVLTIEPNIAHMDKFVLAARDAQSNNRGLWQACRG